MKFYTTRKNKKTNLTLFKLLAILAFTSIQSVWAQDLSYEWAYKIGSPAMAQEYPAKIFTDTAGFVYTTGTMFGTTDFDPSANNFDLNAAFFDGFITKNDAAGNLVWAVNFGGNNADSSHDLFVDDFGNVYATGEFNASGDFDAGAGTTILTSNGFSDIFIVKFDNMGSFQWAKAMGGTGFDKGLSIQVDNNGNVYTTGEFQGTVDFDPGAGTFDMTSTSSTSTFISKLDASGNFVWAKAISATGSNGGNDMVLDDNNNIYITGYFSGTGDFDPGTGTANLTATGGNRDVYIAKLDANGDYVWAKNVGGNDLDEGRSLTLDASGNLIITGNFAGTADFDPNAGTSELISNGGSEVFVLKLDGVNGDYIWAKGFGGSEPDRGISVSVDEGDAIYLTGYFFGTADFDPGAGVTELTSPGISRDAFISKFDPSGDFAWVKHISGESSVEGSGIAVDKLGGVYVTGAFIDTVDFDPGVGVANLPNNGAADIFVLKLSCVTTFGTLTVEACGSYDFNGVTYTADNNTATDTLVNAQGCDSIVTLDLTIVNIDLTYAVNGNEIIANATGVDYQWIDCADNSIIAGETNQNFTATANGNYAVIVSNTVCTDTSDCVVITGVGIRNNATNDSNFHLIPNPSNDVVRIANFDKHIEEIIIVDVTGKVVKYFESVSEQLNISELNNGVYFVQIQNGNKRSTLKLIKN